MRTSLALLACFSVVRYRAIPATALVVLGLLPGVAGAAQPEPLAEHQDTQELVALVTDASKLVQTQGATAFTALRRSGSRWRQEETYAFVLDLQGNMLVHPDPAMEGKNMLDLKDIHGKPIIRGLLDAATAVSGKAEGWYHYQWPVPGGLLPRWKSSYVRLVADPSGKRHVIGSGVYNDRMEKSFVVDLVRDAVGQVEKDGSAAFALFHDPKSRFIAKDAYVFVIDPGGAELVNPAFPNLEGRNLLDLKDRQGKQLVREMLEVARTAGSGWVEYMWPKPGESVPTRKSAFVSKAKVGEKWLLVGCGVYLEDAPRATAVKQAMAAQQLRTLVREGAAMLEKRGAQAYPELRKRGSKWFRDGTYFFVWSLDGTRVFHAADAALEGKNGSGVRDILGRSYGKMFLDVAAAPAGEGWVHYMYPEPGDIFPAWKSVFLKKVTFPSGKQHLIGCGVYNMQMDETLIEDLVGRAAALVADQGKAAFSQLRDKTGPFVFMDTYVFVDSPDGIELVNGAQPSLEGKNLLDMKDVKGKAVAREYIAAAMKDGSAWVEYFWYKPGGNVPVRKRAHVRTAKAGQDTFVVGSGVYSE